MSLKERIPDEASLAKALEQEWGTITSAARAAVGPLEAEYKRVRKRQKIGVGFMIGSAVILQMLDGFFDADWDVFSFLGDAIGLVLGIVLLPILLVLIVAGVFMMRDKSDVVRRFNRGLNQVLFPAIARMLGYESRYLNQSNDVGEIDTPNHQNLVETLLDDSELITESRNRLVVDDMLGINWEGETLLVSELDVKNVTGTGKRRRTKNIFKGYFVSLKLKRELTGKTFVSTEGDTNGFGHKTFWSSLANTGVQETQLEWNDFENLLHVATDNPTEARYVLTTNFMADLYEWWKDKKLNIRISFIGSHVHVLFPSETVQIKQASPSLKDADLKKYASSIAGPMMHVLHLMEDVKL